MQMMHLSDFNYDEAELQKAVLFLTDHFARSGNNPKPVVMHSIRVAALLWERGAPQDSVVAALLHDTLEDTSVAAAEIGREFGERVQQIVESLTITKEGDFATKLANANKSFQKSIALGQDALIVRASDLIDNSHYYKRADTPDLQHHLCDKYTSFMTLAEVRLVNTPYWPLLKTAYDQNVKQFAR